MDNNKALAHILNALLPMMVKGVDTRDHALLQRSRHYLESLFFASLERLRPSVFVEVGAHEATASIRVASGQYCRKSYAFEANPYTFEHYGQQSSAMLMKHSKIAYMNLAIADFQGKATVKIPLTDGTKIPGNASLLYRTADELYEEVPVACTTLDCFFADKLEPDESVAMWMDLEGLAYEALTAATQFLRKTKMVYVEVEERQHWKNQKLSPDVIELMLRNDFLPLARDRGAQQHNILFVRFGVEEIFKDLQIQFLQKSMALGDEGEAAGVAPLLTDVHAH